MGDLIEPGFAELLAQHVDANNKILVALGAEPVRIKDVLADYEAAARYLKPYICDAITPLNAGIDRGEAVLFEGAQGTMLDIDYGTFPFVTSSSATAGGACTGSGVSPNKIDNVLGVIKAYSTRVGEGPFPTELNDETGSQLRATGQEFGATTGRPRRCGWFDAVVVRHAVALSGVDGLAVTKLDVLTGMDPVRLCVGYELDGRRLMLPPATQRGWRDATPIYEDHPGWREPLGRARSLDDLPANARRYLDALTRSVGVPLVLLSIGAGREQTIVLGQTLAT
jgi:adenylosuccinate synthase